MPLTKTAVSTGHQPMGLIFWQLLTAATILTLVLAVQKNWPQLTRENLIFFLTIGLMGTLIPNSFSYIAAAELPAGLMAIIITSVPMFAIAIAFSLKVERFSLSRLAGVLLGAVAVFVLVAAQDGISGAAKPIFILIALVAPFFYGLEGNYIALKAPAHIDPISTLWGASVLGLFIAAPIAYYTDTWVDLTVPWNAAEWALLGSSLFHVIAYATYIWLISVAGPVFSSQIAYIVTISGVFFSAVVLGETYSPWVWASLLLMLGGLTLVQPRKNKS